MAKVELKQPVVNEIKELLTDAQSAVLVSYRGITVEQDTAMRKELREADVEYKVYKNTMIRFAIQGTEFEALADDLKDLQQSLFLKQMLQLLQESLQNTLRTSKYQK